jgi:hypothetical protein
MGFYNLGHVNNFPLALSENDVLTTTDAVGASFNGILVESNMQVDPITESFSTSNSYTVPTGKNLYILEIHHINSNNDAIKINGNLMGMGFYNLGHVNNFPLALSENDVLTTTDAVGASFNGYLVDKDYFEGCGGGGSSTSSLDSTTIANMIANSGGGCNIIYPEGYSGEILTYKFSTDYIVPAGKNLTLTWLSKGSLNAEVLYVNNKKIIPYIGTGGINSYSINKGDMSLRIPLIFSEGDTLSTWYTNQGSPSDMILNGFLTDKNVEPVVHSLCEDNLNWNSPNPGWNGINYFTVPNGKNLIIQAFSSESSTGTYITVDGENFISVEDGLMLPSIPLQLKSGQIIGLSINASPSSPPTNIHFVGYLVDEDYFAGCGGGGGAGNSSSNPSIIDTVYSDYVSFYGSNNGTFTDTISIPYIEGRDLFLTSNNLMAFYGGGAYLKIVDDNGIDVSAKVIGSKDIACTNCAAGSPLISINEIAASNVNNTVSAIVRPYNINTNYLHMFFVISGSGQFSVSGTLNYQY